MSQDAWSDYLDLIQLVDLLSERWTLMIVGPLMQFGTMRFNEIQRANPGMSHQMLTIKLRGLEREGIVSRTPYVSLPKRVDYALTPVGKSLAERLQSMMDWAKANRSAIEAERAAYDAVLEN